MKTCYKLFGFVISLCILLPLLVLAVWSVADNWRYPNLIPEALSMRGLREVLTAQMLKTVLSSVFISAVVAFFSTVVGYLTARALVFYEFPLKKLVEFLNLLPLMVPATAFAMGVHVLFIKLGVSDTVLGVVLVHLICGMPYSVHIMLEVTASAGGGQEEQARCLGAGPLRAFFETSFFALVPGFLTSFCMAYIISFSQYFITLVIGGGSVKTLSVVMIPLIQSGDRTLASAYSLLFVLSTFLVFSACGLLGKKMKSVKLYG